MIDLFWSEKFKRVYKKWVKKNPNHSIEFGTRIKMFTENPFSPKLKTHSLSGKLEGYWSFSLDNAFRVIFIFPENDRSRAILIDIGTHDEVY